jgi:hypothetical protein
MKLPRRNFLHLAAGAAALPAGSRTARAQAYPSRPVSGGALRASNDLSPARFCHGWRPHELRGQCCGRISPKLHGGERLQNWCAR